MYEYYFYDMSMKKQMLFAYVLMTSSIAKRAHSIKASILYLFAKAIFFVMIFS